MRSKPTSTVTVVTSIVACAVAGIGGTAIWAATAPSLNIAIASPAPGTSRPWQGQVSYSVSATYDGKSTKFDELPANDIVLETRFVPDVELAARIGHDLPDALVTISQSNCSGCHDFDARSAGPSYAAIGARYAGQPSAAAALALHITKGSSGTWGAAAMPPHPDLTAEQAKAVAEWIIAHGNDGAVHYQVGTTGSFRMTPVGTPGPRAGIVATAYYSGPLKPGDTRSSTGTDRVAVIGVPGS